MVATAAAWRTAAACLAWWLLAATPVAQAQDGLPRTAAECRAHPPTSARVDCECYAAYIAQSRENVFGAASQAYNVCRSLEAIERTERRGCEAGWQQVVPRGLEVAPFCGCYAAELAHAFLAHPPQDIPHETISTWRWKARQVCEASGKPAAPASGLDLSGVWRFVIQDIRLRIETPAGKWSEIRLQPGVTVKAFTGGAVLEGWTEAVGHSSMRMSQRAETGLLDLYFEGGIRGFGFTTCEAADVSTQRIAGRCFDRRTGAPVPFLMERYAAGAPGVVSPQPPVSASADPTSHPMTQCEVGPDGRPRTPPAEWVLLAPTDEERVVRQPRDANELQRLQQRGDPAEAFRAALERRNGDRGIVFAVHVMDRHPGTLEACRANGLLVNHRQRQASMAPPAATAPSQAACAGGRFLCVQQCLTSPRPASVQDALTRAQACPARCDEVCR